MTPREIFDRHVKLFNDGVRSRDFGPMTSHLIEDAEMFFEGIPVGPFKGRTAIERSYSGQPPDDEIIVLSVRDGHTKNVIVGEYAWSKKPELRAGEMIIATKGDRIEKLTIRYEG